MGDDGKNTLTIRDNRTGRNYDVDILEGDVIRAMDLRQIKVDDGDFGMMAYDPALRTRRRRAAPSHSSTARRASCVIAATRSSSSPSAVRTWKSPT